MSFASLPPEIQTRILLDAVQPPHGRYAHAPTLALVSRSCYYIISSLLWRHIRVTTPSALRQFHAALQSRPELAASTQSVHLGPDSEIYQRGWPLEVKHELGDEVTLLIMPTLPASALPHWVDLGEAFDIEYTNGRDFRQLAISRAIKQIFEDLDVNPQRRGYSSGRGHPPCRIGIRAWALRLWEAQAALDLYLAEMRRREDEDDEERSAHSSGSDEEPQFKVRRLYSTYDFGISISDHPPPVNSDHDQLHLTKDQLWSHLSRRGSSTDHFSHLVFFARSRREDLGMSDAEWSDLKHDLGGPHRRFRMSPEEDSDDESTVADEAELAEERFVGASEASVGSVGELLKVAREVLALMPQVTNLSVASFLHRAMDGLQCAKVLLQLNIGPIAPWWNDCLSFLSPGSKDDNGSGPGTESEESEAGAKGAAEGQLTMPGLEQLRICGTISVRDAQKIATQLRSLREVVWEEPSEIYDGGEG